MAAIQWNCFPERRLNRNQARFRGLVWNDSRGGGATFRTGDGDCERFRVDAFPPFFFELTWFILCLIMINLAIQAGGPLSRTGLRNETLIMVDS